MMRRHRDHHFLLLSPDFRCRVLLLLRFLPHLRHVICSHGTEELDQTQEREQHADKHPDVDGDNVRHSDLVIDNVVHRDE